ncbi:tetratricopeptide repeat protein [Fulvivirgaceae bacterium BMA10]|uniref:Tetratricopeptide repeat protein n=1 Tax=Splendidivirga corallicola TaxID=3051826 RepID=A0ABT8KPR2_9BACT|nr:tetratricopeptide repeat protein [Fulvivirgaceae bacterium BMA10]
MNDRLRELEDLKDHARQNISFANIVLTWTSVVFGSIGIFTVIAGFVGWNRFRKLKNELDEYKYDLEGAINHVHELQNELKSSYDIWFENLYKLNDGIGYFNAGKYSMAIVLFQEVLNKNSRDYLAKCYMGKTMLEQGKHHLAIKEASEALDLNTSPDLANLVLGEAHKRLQNFDAAILFFKESYEINPRVGTLNHLAYAYLNNGDYDQSEMTFREVRTETKQSHTALCGLVKCYLKKGDYSVTSEIKMMCTRTIESAVKSKGKKIANWPYPDFNMAFCHLVLGDYEKSKEHLKSALLLTKDPCIVELQLFDYMDLKIKNRKRAIEGCINILRDFINHK